MAERRPDRIGIALRGGTSATAEPWWMASGSSCRAPPASTTRPAPSRTGRRTSASARSTTSDRPWPRPASASAMPCGSATSCPTPRSSRPAGRALRGALRHGSTCRHHDGRGPPRPAHEDRDRADRPAPGLSRFRTAWDASRPFPDVPLDGRPGVCPGLQPGGHPAAEAQRQRPDHRVGQGEHVGRGRGPAAAGPGRGVPRCLGRATSAPGPSQALPAQEVPAVGRHHAEGVGAAAPTHRRPGDRFSGAGLNRRTASTLN